MGISINNSDDYFRSVRLPKDGNNPVNNGKGTRNASDITAEEKDSVDLIIEDEEEASDKLVEEFRDKFCDFEYTLDEAKDYLKSIGADIIENNNVWFTRIRGKFIDTVEFKLNGKKYKVERLGSAKNEDEKKVMQFKKEFHKGEYTLDEAAAYVESLGAKDVETSSWPIYDKDKKHKAIETLEFTIGSHTYEFKRENDDRLTQMIKEKADKN